MKLDIDMTREQLIESISAIFIVERKHRDMILSKEHAVLDNLSYKLHMAINPTPQEWVKTDYFDQYFTEELKEKYLKNK